MYLHISIYGNIRNHNLKKKKMRRHNGVELGVFSQYTIQNWYSNINGYK